MPIVVWIEDDAPVITPVLAPLVAAGYEVVEIKSVAEALTKMDVIRSADAVLMDVILPLGGAELACEPYSGLALLRLIREQEHIETPIVIFTVVDVEPFKLELERDLRVSAILKKPVLPSELKRRIEQAIENRTKR